MAHNRSHVPASLPAFATVRDAAPNPFLSSLSSGAPRATEEATPAWPTDSVFTRDADPLDVEEIPGAEAVDVRVLWGTNVLHFTQMCPPRPFCLGGAGSDVALPGAESTSPEAGPRATRPLVVVREETAYVLAPRDARVFVKDGRGVTMSLDECSAAGFAKPSLDDVGAFDILLPEGATATLQFPESELRFEVSRSRARRTPAVGFFAGADWTGQIFTGLSAFAHVAVLGALAFFMPAMHGDDSEAVDRDAVAAMRPYLEAIAEKEPEHLEAVAEMEARAPSGGGRGSQAEGPSGKMGSSVTTVRDPARFAVRGDAPETKLSRERALAEAVKFGLVGVLNTEVASSANTPIARWGESTALGRDAKSALGSLWDPEAGDTWGSDGLGISGTGEGGGGLAHGVGLAGVGSTVGGGSGNLPGDGPSHGPGAGYGPGGHGPRGMPGHETHVPHMTEATFSANGTLPREVIQRVVRQNFGRFRLCYEGGLRTNPGLSGRVAVDFVIDHNGGVAVALADRTSDMPDANVVACVVRGFQNLSFPAPQNGMVQVVYPLLLAPGE